MRLVCSLVSTACLAALGVVAVAAPVGAAVATGAITGSVDDAATGAAVTGVCVYAYPVSAYGPRTNPSAPNPTPYEATTAVDGSYEMGVPDSGYDNTSVGPSPKYTSVLHRQRSSLRSRSWLHPSRAKR